MKIVIDARMYGLEHAGIGRYVINLVNQIERLDKKNQYYLLLRKKYFQKLKLKNRNFRKILADYPHYSFQEQIFLLIKLLKIKPDLVHFPHFNTPILWWGKQVVTIHDLIKHQSKGPQTTTRWRPLYWFKYLNYRFLVWVSVKKSIKIIVPSKYWKKELVQRFKLKPEKIEVTYEGIGDKFKIQKSDGKIIKKYRINKPFVIYTGNLYPHKNVEKLVQAIKLLNEGSDLPNKLTLVIVCARSVFLERFKKRVKEMEAERLVSLLGFVPDEDLVALYQEAKAFVFPTFLEGFGLPGLEAMAAGLPVVCSDILVLREIYGQAALYFDPQDVEDMTEKIKSVISDTKLRKTLIEKGFKQIKKYSWQKMAKQTLGVYESASV